MHGSPSDVPPKLSIFPEEGIPTGGIGINTGPCGELSNSYRCKFTPSTMLSDFGVNGPIIGGILPISPPIGLTAHGGIAASNVGDWANFSIARCFSDFGPSNCYFGYLVIFYLAPPRSG